jgi:hypothetical protein
MKSHDKETIVKDYNAVRLTVSQVEAADLEIYTSKNVVM